MPMLAQLYFRTAILFLIEQMRKDQHRCRRIDIKVVKLDGRANQAGQEDA